MIRNNFVYFQSEHEITFYSNLHVYIYDSKQTIFFQSKHEHDRRQRRLDRGPLLLHLRARRPDGSGRQAHEAGGHSRRIQTYKVIPIN